MKTESVSHSVVSDQARKLEWIAILFSIPVVSTLLWVHHTQLTALELEPTWPDNSLSVEKWVMDDLSQGAWCPGERECP